MEINRSLRMLTRELDGWRGESQSRRPLPAQFWSEAVRLANRMGVGPVSKALRLDYTKLKRLACSNGDSLEPISAPTFVELLPLPYHVLGDCAVEVESSNGARMRIQLQNTTSSGLAGLVREFVA